MPEEAAAPSVTLRRLTNGYQVSQAISVAAQLGIADRLADGPRSADDLAAVTGAQPRPLYRLLRALAAAGVLAEDPDRRFNLTPVGECLRADAPEPIVGWAAYIGEPYYWQSWAHLRHSVETGETGFRHAHGMSPWEYRERDSIANDRFNRAMSSLSNHVSAAVLAAYDFAPYRTVVDVGGGHGAFLASILARHPGAAGILFDQPHVVAGADAVLATADVANRCRIVGGSFFDAVPEGGDAYVLKAVVHDWDDAEASAILRVCRKATHTEARLLLVEREIGPPNEGAETKFSDLNMLVAPGGLERTREEFADLLAVSGFRMVRVVPSTSGFSVIEAVPA